jgi:hypothetical protein
VRITPPSSQAVLSVVGPVLVLAALGIPSAINLNEPIPILGVIAALLGTIALQYFGINVTAPSNPFPTASLPTAPTINAGQAVSKSD